MNMKKPVLKQSSSKRFSTSQKMQLFYTATKFKERGIGKKVPHIYLIEQQQIGETII
jgi:hypothetical protein